MEAEVRLEQAEAKVAILGTTAQLSPLEGYVEMAKAVATA